MRGWRGFIGRVEPSMWYEGQDWGRMLPEGVALVITALGVQHLVPDELDSAYAAILDRVRRLAGARVDVINLGGSPVVTSRGLSGHDELLRLAREMTDIPIITSLMAETEALRAVGAKKVAIAAPYPHAQTERRRQFLEELGFTVVAARGLNIETTDEIARLDETSAHRFARQVAREAASAEALYLPCGSWPVIDLIEALEEDAGMPVITNTQAQVWACLKALGCRAPVAGFGSLFQV